MDRETIIAKISEMTIEYAPKVLLAILTLIIGFWIIKKITRLLGRSIASKGMDISLSRFLMSVVDILLKVMLLLSVAGMFGVNTTSFIAIIGALMVGVGMALNGSLGHIASGVMLMIFKPFKVGDVVIIGGGEIGRVEGINAFNTTLLTVENRKVFIANSNVTGNTITNISGQGTAGVSLTFGIGYTDDIDKARSIILEVGSTMPKILKDPPMAVVVSTLADSSVNLTTRPFCESKDYWDVLFYMNENVKKAFDKAGIGIPYPQLDVHMIKDK